MKTPVPISRITLNKYEEKSIRHLKFVRYSDGSVKVYEVHDEVATMLGDFRSTAELKVEAKNLELHETDISFITSFL